MTTSTTAPTTASTFVPAWVYWASLGSPRSDGVEATIDHAQSSFGSMQAGWQVHYHMGSMFYHLRDAVRDGGGALYAEVRPLEPEPDPVRGTLLVETTGRCYVHRPGSSAPEPPVDLHILALFMTPDTPS